MSCGKEFVEILKKIGYPKADELSGEDFDWLFESSEDKSFLEWFCGNVKEQHVLSEEELQDFNRLLESGKPILEGNALDEVLKTCKPSDSGNSSREEEEELKKLEDEFQTLQKMKNLTIHRHNKLQMMISENSSMLQTLKIKEEEAQKDLKEGLELFTAAVNKLNSELLSLVNRVKKLASFSTASASEQGSDLHPVFFSQFSLDKYLSQEEDCTAALASYAQKHFYQGMSELAENLQEDNFELADISKHGTCAEATEACGKSQEIASLQAAYICAQRQLIELQAEEESLKSAIECAASMLSSPKSKGTGKQENIEAKISSLNDEISTIKQQIAQINNEDLPSLLKEHAQLFTAPVVMANLDREIAQQDHFASKQDEICRHLIRQKASFELIQLAYDIELKKHKDIHCQLEDLIESLKQSSNEIQQRLEVLSKETKLAKPRNTISSKDDFSCRLYQLLEGENKKQLFKTYKNLEQMAQKLNQDCVAAQDQLAASSQEQSHLLSKLDSDVNALHDALYCGGNQILLTSRELTEQFHQLEGDLNKLNQLIVDLTADVKSKRNFLASSKLHQMERNLYVYFFKDENRLKEMVEKLEQQSEAKARGLEDENFTTSLIIKMEHFTSYIGCEISEVPLSDTAQRIMSALRSIPAGVQTSRKNNQSKEKTKEDKLGDKDAGLKNEKEISESTVALLKSSASSEKSTAGETVRTACTKEILCCQDTKILNFYQDLDSPKWRYREKNLTVVERNMVDGEKNLATPLKRKQELPTYCLGKKRLLVKKHISHEKRYNWTSRQTEPSEKEFCDIRSLGYEEKRELIANIKEAVAFVTTMIFLDGSSQLNSEQTLTSSVKGIVVLLKSRTDRLCSLSLSSTDSTWSTASQSDRFIYLETECSSLWEQEEQAHNKFAREVLFQILRCKVPVICFNAKDFLKMVLQVYGNGISWKQVADSIVLDPRIAAWLINSNDTVPSFECLIQCFGKSYSVEMVNTDTGTVRNSLHQNLGVNLQKLYTIMMGLARDLQVQGLWKLFCTLELPLIKVLAVMETHKIHVDKQELKKTSEILGLRLKELEEEAHQLAGERFLLTSSSQLREVLFEKLKLHTVCEKIPRTERQQVASTSEVVLSKLQDLHPLPKLMLEYRQVRKMKSTYVDGLRTYMRKGFICPTWNQTGTVTGRLSSKHPPLINPTYPGSSTARGRDIVMDAMKSSLNLMLHHTAYIPAWPPRMRVPYTCYATPRTTLPTPRVLSCINHVNAGHQNIQGISKHPVRITKKQYIKGKEEEMLTISPRALFVSKKGYTFLAADFSQIELRILADLSAEPELLKLFQEPETTDIFTSLASQWKGIPSEQVKQADREQAKRIVYSVVYGAGKERLAECLGITPLEASHFIESFMQKYKKVHEFTKKTIGQCQNKGYVVSIMGRKRLLANISSQDYKLRTQAERQAVNFVVQGSAADLCKMAMVEIFTSVVVSPTLTARLIAQIHDELLFEVEDSQIQEFSALVKRTMESLQQTTALEVPLKVPLKVLLTTGKSWGCMTELQEM